MPLVRIYSAPSEFNRADVEFKPIEMGICFVNELKRLIAAFKEKFEAVDAPSVQPVPVKVSTTTNKSATREVRSQQATTTNYY